MASSDAGTREFSADQVAGREGDGEAPTRQFLAAPVSDRCVNCGTPLAPDQHYCINCGERRGKARFPVGAPATGGTSYERVTTEPLVPPEPRLTSSSVFVTGVGVLLLAMGVGVLIGYLATKNNNLGTGRQVAAAAPQVITVNGGGGGGGSGSSAPTTAGGGGHSSKAAKAAAPLPSKKAVAKGQAAASKVLGASATKNLPPPTVTVGAKGKGPGYKNGHFTGTFFGSG